eukprot:86742-Chlamydomonas_euryale.AAC.1
MPPPAYAPAHVACTAPHLAVLHALVKLAQQLVVLCREVAVAEQQVRRDARSKRARDRVAHERGTAAAAAAAADTAAAAGVAPRPHEHRRAHAHRPPAAGRPQHWRQSRTAAVQAAVPAQPLSAAAATAAAATVPGTARQRRKASTTPPAPRRAKPREHRMERIAFVLERLERVELRAHARVVGRTRKRPGHARSRRRVLLLLQPPRKRGVVLTVVAAAAAAAHAGEAERGRRAIA